MEEQYSQIPQEYYEQPKQPVSPNDIYASQLNEEKIRNIVAQISPSNQVQEIEMRLKGYKKNFMTDQWEKISENAGNIPEDLVSRYVSWLSTFMNINTTLGNLSGGQITGLMRNAIEWVVDDIDAHAEEYGISGDYTERTRLADMLLTSTFVVLNRSLNGIESRRFWSSLSMAESSSMMPQQSKSSDWWKFWKK